MTLEWIDLAIKTSEGELASAISSLSAKERARLTDSLLQLFQMPREDLEISVLRLLVERSRGLALPTALWSRPITASTSVKSESQRHLSRLGLADTPERLAGMNDLYRAFRVTERDAAVTLKALEAQGFRCSHCGLAFCNEQIEKYAVVSPHGSRKKPKIDPLKPHWSIGKKEHLEPTMDHIWSIKVFGNNDAKNLGVKCRGCNNGKTQYLAMEQFPDWTGLCKRPQLEEAVVPWELFFAQLLRQPVCEKSGEGASETELTVVLRDPLMPAVLDNLRTVASPGV